MHSRGAVGSWYQPAYPGDWHLQCAGHLLCCWMQGQLDWQEGCPRHWQGPGQVKQPSCHPIFLALASLHHTLNMHFAQQIRSTAIHPCAMQGAA